ncbi:NACHT domain-containing protein [Spirosoma sp. HMF3257]|uniref:Novel STAND NTPase 1 domain-containing protein n=1 Tax=Spirosoma telluris TaxID=2183553 RepID=A0A327NQ57_9BACT|nr:NACHT domain-containing protein [Spirosoma telluris]RAI75914.1 hypothetical protein HMF3257_20245 [Spirosoma telluris]
MKSPFKFLDSFTLADKDVFFGRDAETKHLYRQVQQTPLLILYGLSGTGKTSLVQCGLASEFDGPDWLPIWVRHQTNINVSLQTAIKRLMPEIKGNISEQIQQLYEHFLRPVYLIFDQFEELFVLGTTIEREEFITTLKNLLEDELPCTILIIIREEFLGRLYPFERAIPHLFEFRMRVELMDYDNVKTVLRESFQKFNISTKEIEGDPKEACLDEIIQNVSLERSGIELPYLQVYLDQLYREDFKRTYPSQLILDGQKWPQIEFTKEEISEFGKIDKVLNKYLDEQIERIQTKLVEHTPDTPTNAVKAVLDGFVSDEETKRPLRYERDSKIIKPDESQRAYFPKLADSDLTICLEELERAKLLRFEPDIIEVAHDSLAKIIYAQRTDEQREQDNMKRQIRLAMTTFDITGEYLTRKQLAKFEDILPQLEKDANTFFEDSKSYRDREDEDKIEKERLQNKKLQDALTQALNAEQIAQQNQQRAEQNAKNNKYLIYCLVSIFAIVSYFFSSYIRQNEKLRHQTKTADSLAKAVAYQLLKAIEEKNGRLQIEINDQERKTNIFKRAAFPNSLIQQAEDSTRKLHKEYKLNKEKEAFIKAKIR